MRQRPLFVIAISFFVSCVALSAQDLAAASREAREKKQAPSPSRTVYTNDSSIFTSAQPAPTTVHTNDSPTPKSGQTGTTKKAQICSPVPVTIPRKVVIGRDNDGHPIYDQPYVQTSKPIIECVDAPDEPVQPIEAAKNVPAGGAPEDSKKPSVEETNRLAEGYRKQISDLHSQIDQTQKQIDSDQTELKAREGGYFFTAGARLQDESQFHIYQKQTQDAIAANQQKIVDLNAQIGKIQDEAAGKGVAASSLQ